MSDHQHHHHPTMDETTLASVTTTAMPMDHIMMNHSAMDHSAMDHSAMDHSAMDHSAMDHSAMDHSAMDHSAMDHSPHVGHSMVGMDMHNGSMGPGMKMYFHDGYNEYVLFQECLTASVGAMVGACFAIFVLAILYEGLKFLREVLLQRAHAARASENYSVDGFKSGTSQEQITTVIRTPSISSQIFSSAHFVQTLLHMLQVFISYCLMLVFMTYNVWLCLSVIVGAGVGYFIFGWKRAVVVDSNEHCH